MTAILGAMFFLAAFAFAGWVIVDSVRPRLGRILSVLQYGPVAASELPARARTMARVRPEPMRPMPIRMSVPQQLRAAA